MKTHKTKDQKLHQWNDDTIIETHEKDLGLQVPADYFSTSKNEILSKVLNRKESKLILFSRKKVIWGMAASVALLFGLAVFNQYSNSKQNQISMVQGDTTDVLTIDNHSLVQTDTNTNTKLKEYNLKPYNVILNENDFLIQSLFVEDSEIDQYIDNHILEDI
jgi:hypothetical protein